MDVAAAPVRGMGSRTSSLRAVLDLRVSTSVGAVPVPAQTNRVFVPGVPPDQSSIDFVGKNVQMAVFDFDQCIMAIHAFALKIEPSQVPNRTLESDFTDLPFFLGLITMLRSAGIKVAIASFGRYEVIQAYMDRAFGIVPGDPASEAQRVFTRENISTPSTVGIQDGWAVVGGKNKQLAALAQHFNVPLGSILFFDDDSSNIDAAFEGGVRFSVHCPQGLDGMAWAKAVDIVTLRAGSSSAKAALEAQQQPISAGAAAATASGSGSGSGSDTPEHGAGMSAARTSASMRTYTSPASAVLYGEGSEGYVDAHAGT